MIFIIFLYCSKVSQRHAEEKALLLTVFASASLKWSLLTIVLAGGPPGPFRGEPQG